MEETVVSMVWLVAFFLVVAFSYASVGLGGGSSYTALMTVFGVNLLAIPTISLTLNLLVTSVGSCNFVRSKHTRTRLIVPFLVSSIPMAYLGGSLCVPENVFCWVLLATLVFVALRIYIMRGTPLKLGIGGKGRVALALSAGAGLGLAAGIAGIGGGICLVPIIVVLGLGTAKESAALGVIPVEWTVSDLGLDGCGKGSRS